MTATKKPRTARSASTPSIHQESTDLYNRILQLEISNRDIFASAQDNLFKKEEYLRRAEAAEAVVRMREAKISEVTALLVRFKMEVARKDGYIDRVRETDTAGLTTTPVRNPAPGELDPFLMDDIRSAMAQADEGTFDRIVSSMSEEALHKVMGKNPNEQSDILR